MTATMRVNLHGKVVYFLCFYIIGSVVIVLGLLGNSLVIVYFGFKEKKTPYNIFILLLAISDLSGTISSLLLLVLFILADYNSSVDLPGVCMIMRPVVENFLGVSSFLVLGMSYERFRGITKPINSRRTRLTHVVNYSILISIAWALFGIPLYKPTAYYHSNCMVIFPDTWFIYSVAVVFVKSILPSVLIGYFYFQIKKTLKQQQQHNFKTTAIFRRNTTALRTLRTLTICFEVFVVIPSILPPLSNKAILGRKEIWEYVVDAAATGLPLVNNAVNCFVYAGYDGEFRGFLLALFCMKSNKRRRRRECLCLRKLKGIS